MRRITPIIILTLFSLISSAQSNDERIRLLTVTYTGDSTLCSERYEINILKKKVYYITPIWNYSDIKGVKYRTRKKINKKKWKEIAVLANKIEFQQFEEIKKDNPLETMNSKEKQIYTIEIETLEKEIKRYKIPNESETKELNDLFKMIREIK